MSETLHFLQACTLLPFTHPHLLLPSTHPPLVLPFYPPFTCSSLSPIFHPSIQSTHPPPTPPFHLLHPSTHPTPGVLVSFTHFSTALLLHSPSYSSVPPTLVPLLPSTDPPPAPPIHPPFTHSSLPLTLHPALFLFPAHTRPIYPTHIAGSPYTSCITTTVTPIQCSVIYRWYLYGRLF